MNDFTKEVPKRDGRLVPPAADPRDRALPSPGIFVEPLESRVLLDGLTFATHQDFDTGREPIAVVAADLTGDGKLDLVTANDNAGSVSVLLGNGDGTFQAAINMPVGSGPISVPVALAIGDVNGDGKPDIVVANYTGGYTGTVDVLLGNGDGTFATGAILPVGHHPKSIALADLTGDGKLDIVEVNNGASGTADVLLGNGDGTFQAPRTFQVGPYPQAVAVAQMNGDSFPDIVVAGNDSVSVLLGNGDGTFKPRQSTAVGSGPRALAIADLNGDGINDVVTANYTGGYPGTVSVLLGNGDGTFQPQQQFATGDGPRSVSIADLNGDGRPDLVVANYPYASNSVSVLLGNGDGTFQAHQDFGTASHPRSVIAADLNGDGAPDLVVAAGYSPSVVSVLLSTTTAGSGFSALDNGALSITGTSGNDTISLSVDPNTNLLTVMRNGVSSPGYAVAGITSINLLGQAGDDVITVGSGMPPNLGVSVQGGLGNDTIGGGPGNDTLSGGQGNDLIFGGPGDDLVHGGKGDDSLAGGQGNDVLFGGLGNDTIRGGMGADTLTGGAGDNLLYGGPGDDSLFAANGSADTLYGGAGTNTAAVDPGNLDQIPNNDLQTVLME
jgi:hypothetical protein